MLDEYVYNITCFPQWLWFIFTFIRAELLVTCTSNLYTVVFVVRLIHWHRLCKINQYMCQCILEEIACTQCTQCMYTTHIFTQCHVSINTNLCRAVKYCPGVKLTKTCRNYHLHKYRAGQGINYTHDITGIHCGLRKGCISSLIVESVIWIEGSFLLNLQVESKGEVS